MPTEKELLKTDYTKWSSLPKVLLRREIYGESDMPEVVRWEVYVHEDLKYKPGRFRFILFSPQYDRVVGIGHDEMAGCTPYEVLSTHDAARVSRQYEDCIEANKPIGYSEYLEIGGMWRWWKTNLKPVWTDDGKRIWKLVGHSRQITSIEANLRDAIRKEELECWYQPIYKINKECTNNDSPTDKCLVGFESLIRWPGTRYSPADFVPVAKASGIIEEITKLSISHAVKSLYNIDKNLWISVNVSNCKFDQHLIEKTLGINPARLRLEITEDTLVNPEILQRFNRINLLGHEFELDDFGTESSNLSWLNQFNPIGIKLDRQFVTGAYKDENRANICRNAVSLAKNHSPPLEVILEGIETPEDLKFAQDIGADYIQGWLFGKAKPFES